MRTPTVNRYTVTGDGRTFRVFDTATRTFVRGVFFTHNRAMARATHDNIRAMADLVPILQTRIAELEAALKTVTDCLVEHLSQEAHDKNVRVEELCPCFENEVKQARAALEGRKA